jgi:ribulose-5-phosphate 4-epimerase/fuculose-1-phosphate aldolase
MRFFFLSRNSLRNRRRFLVIKEHSHQLVYRDANNKRYFAAATPPPPTTNPCPITQNYAESGPCGPLFRTWYECHDQQLAPQLFQDWLHCLEKHDEEEQLDAFFQPSVPYDNNNKEDSTFASGSNNLTVNNQVKLAWETFIQHDLPKEGFPFPDSLKPRTEWTSFGRVTILLKNDQAHTLVAMFVQDEQGQLLAAAAPHNLLAHRILSFQLPQTSDNSNGGDAAENDDEEESPETRMSVNRLIVSALYETDHKQEVLCQLILEPPTSNNSAVTGLLSDSPNNDQEIQSMVQQHLSLSSSSSSPDLANIQNHDQVGCRNELTVAHRYLNSSTTDNTLMIKNSCLLAQRFENGWLETPATRRQPTTMQPQDINMVSTDTKNLTSPQRILKSIFAARSDIQAVAYLQTPCTVAVACLQQGLLLMTHEATAVFHNKIATCALDNLDDSDMEIVFKTIERSQPTIHTLLIGNHGLVCFGSTLQQVVQLASCLETNCQIQLSVLQTGAAYTTPSSSRNNDETASSMDQSRITLTAAGLDDVEWWETLRKQVAAETENGKR